MASAPISNQPCRHSTPIDHIRGQYTPDNEGIAQRSAGVTEKDIKLRGNKRREITTINDWQANLVLDILKSVPHTEKKQHILLCTRPIHLNVCVNVVVLS